VSGLPPIFLLTADAPGILPEFGPLLWGIFDEGGQPVLISDAIEEVDYDRGYDVSSYPQEKGAFFNYNKVQDPYESKVTLLSSQTRQQLFSILEPACASLQRVSIVMPEMSYPSANLLRYGFRRTAQRGATLVAVDVWCKEIRVTSSSALSSSGGQGQGGQGQGAGVQGAAGGTNRPVGQVSNQELNGATTASLFPAAIDTGSTNAAFPTQSGPVQPTDRSSLTSSWTPIQPPS
jgi:hypothetical protein